MEIIDALMLGTKNAAKIHGVQAAFADVLASLQTPDQTFSETWTCQVETGVSDEPWGFANTVQGAQNRAQAAYARLMSGSVFSPLAPGQVAVGMGVESGFIDVTPVTFTLYNFDVCALFDGQAYYLGISP